MYCQHCGKGLSNGSHFCSNCGAALNVEPPVVRQGRIVRPRYPRMVAGVCAGFAQHFGWDVTLVRVLFAVFTVLTSGCGVPVYIAAWVLMPDAPFELTTTSTQAGANQQGTTA